MPRIVLGAVLLAALLPASAAAAPVVVLDGSHVERRNDRFLPRAELPPVRFAAPRAVAASATATQRAPGRAPRTPLGELKRLLRLGAISPARYAAARAAYGSALSLASRLHGVPLAARRAGGLAWEQYFTFDGGAPPWASSITQGTAVQALARGSGRLGEPGYGAAARAGLALFATAPPAGVQVRTRAGSHYLIYSFAPRVRVLNAFMQALAGLFDVSRIDPGSRAGALFAAGDREAQREVPSYDTGKWSLYQPGVISSLSYHVLLRDFLANLCARTGTRVYCATAERFTGYLAHPQASSERAPVRRR